MHDGEHSRTLLVVLFLLISLLIGCQNGEELEETDPLYDYILRAQIVRLDPGTAGEIAYRGDSLAGFLDRFQPDPFRPGPRSVRIENSCRPASITIEGYTYPATLCTLTTGSRQPVFSVGLDTAVVRLIGRR